MVMELGIKREIEREKENPQPTIVPEQNPGYTPKEIDENIPEEINEKIPSEMPIRKNDANDLMIL